MRFFTKWLFYSLAVMVLGTGFVANAGKGDKGEIPPPPAVGPALIRTCNTDSKHDTPTIVMARRIVKVWKYVYPHYVCGDGKEAPTGLLKGSALAEEMAGTRFMYESERARIEDTLTTIAQLDNAAKLIPKHWGKLSADQLKMWTEISDRRYRVAMKARLEALKNALKYSTPVKPMKTGR